MPNKKDDFPATSFAEEFLASIQNKENIQNTYIDNNLVLLQHTVDNINRLTAEAEEKALITPLIDPNKSVVMSNKFSVAVEECTLFAYKLCRVAISQIGMEDKELLPVTITTKDIKSMGYSPTRLTGHMNEVLDEILSYRIKIASEDPNKSKSGKLIGINVFTSAICNTGKGSITVNLNPSLKNHFIGLRKEFVQYPQITATKFKSYAAGKLHDILLTYARRYGSGGQVFLFSIEELAVVLRYNYKNKFIPSDFIRNCVKRAVAAINETSELYVEYLPIREGRESRHIRFYVYDYDSVEDKKRAESEDSSDATTNETHKLLRQLNKEEIRAILKNGENEIYIDGITSI